MSFSTRRQRNGDTRPRRRALWLLYGAFALQAVSAFFFVGELWTEILGLRTTPIPYAWQELIQVLASIGIITGVIASGVFVRRGLDYMHELDRQVDVAAGNYETHLTEIFDGWGLSPSEKSVAIYAMKGFSNAEIAGFRQTSVATIKSQTNAIYRKSGLGNRPQLISFLVEELLAGINVDTRITPPN
ncbi:MAG: helix-turn-helix transcriptional regulator [Rhodobacteraceae bacterium]|nr:helix-turn-helix transcriptional regulator [Paracoccaceae bacterium]